jgi:hypothetical protein
MKLVHDTLHRRIAKSNSLRAKIAAQLRKNRARLRRLEAVPEIGTISKTVASEAALVLAAMQERHGELCKSGSLDDMASYVQILGDVARIVDASSRTAMHGDRMTLGKLRLRQGDARLDFAKEKFSKTFMRDTSEMFLRWMEEKKAAACDILDSPGQWEERVNRIGQLMYGQEWSDAVTVDSVTDNGPMKEAAKIEQPTENASL